MEETQHIRIGLDTVLSDEFKKIWDHFSTGIFITDAQLTTLYMNPAQEAIDGIKASQVLGRKVTDIYTADDEFSITDLCIARREVIKDYTYCYYVNNETMVLSMSSIFPLFEGDRLTGTINFVNSVAINQRVFNGLAVSFEQHTKTEKPEKYTFGDIIGQEYTFQRMINQARRCAVTDAPVMIWGESGVGKELVAQAIHAHSQRQDHPFVPINCAAIPEALLESLLFGTAKGAFTGAVEKVGLLESAHRGTVLLDELNSMPLALQAKLLRALQEKRIRRVGAVSETPIDIRVISIMNISPKQALADQHLRKDLFYRLGVVILKIPPLRKRKLDIPLLCPALLKKHRHISGKKVYIDDEVYTQFFNYHWPGNVRELEHVVQGALSLMSSGNRILKAHVQEYLGEGYEEEGSLDGSHRDHDRDMEDIMKMTREILSQQMEITQAMARNIPGMGEASPAKTGETKGLKAHLAQVEKEYIQEYLDRTDRNISKTARLLEISPQNLHYKIKKYGL